MEGMPVPPYTDVQEVPADPAAADGQVPTNGLDPRAEEDRTRPQLPRNTCCSIELNAPDFVGPALKLVGCVSHTNLWNASVLVVCRADRFPDLRLHFSDNGVRNVLEPMVIGEYGGWVFLRWQIQCQMLDHERAITYWVACPKPSTRGLRGLFPSGPSGYEDTPQIDREYQFYVPGQDQAWHWGFYSCSGFSNDVPEEEKAEKYGGITPLWNDVLAQHAKHPFHCMVGGGDQLYNDDLFQLPSIKKWLSNKDFEQRRHTPATPEMARELASYYFHHYCVHWSVGPIQQAYATIPQVMTWDDHDIFDGWGSYPTDLQKCSVFQAIFEAARRFYLLFQLQTNQQLAKQDGYFGVDSYSAVVLLGSRVAIALPDQRAERTHHVIMPMEMHFMLLSQLNSLPRTVKHLIFVATVPVVYPHLTGSHTVLKALRGATRLPLFGTILTRLGISEMLLSRHSEPELLDDLRDHWEAPAHLEERRFLLEHLQMLARAWGVRVTLISGDVHLCGTGCTHGIGRHHVNKIHDYRYMPQIISSAIINAPPPDILARALRLVSRPKMVNRHTRLRMVKVFDDHKRRKQMLNRRNWCEVWETENVPLVSPAATQGMNRPLGTLVFSLRVEDLDKPPKGGLHPGNLKAYDTYVPPLLLKQPRRGQEGFYDRAF